MIATKSSSRRLGPVALLLALAALLIAAAPAAAAPKWSVESLAPTNAAAGGTQSFLVTVKNVGDAPAEAAGEPFVLSATLPPGLAAIAATPALAFGWDCSAFLATLSCESTSATINPYGFNLNSLVVEVAVDPGAAGVLTSRFQIAGGGAPGPASSADPTTIAPDPAGFGIDAFDQLASADASGTPSTQAAGSPYELTTSIDFNSVSGSDYLQGLPRPAEPVKDVVVDLPPGLIGNTAGIPQCTIVDLAAGEGVVSKPECKPESQIGTTLLRTERRILPHLPGGGSIGPVPVYNLVPPPDAPARFGFNIAGTIVTIDARLRSSGDYGVSAISANTPEGLAVTGVDFTLWGVPADPAHERDRGCSGEQFPSTSGVFCPSDAPEVSFLRNPTTCEDEASGSLTSARIDSWFHPGSFEGASSASHLSPGFPFPREEWGDPQGPSDCENVPFDPVVEASPTTEAADSPSGLDFHLRVPQGCWAERDSICQSDLRAAEVTLPAGMSLNPSSASGLSACTPAQVGLTSAVGASPIRFDEAKAACPNSAKIGALTIATPLLEAPLTGSVYLAEQSQNPFGSMLAMYIVAEGSGVVVKQAGEIKVGPGGQLTTVFRDAPQVPFSDLHVSLFGGPRGPLRTPPTCGTYMTEATLTPWSGNPASVIGSAFEITNCGSGGFDPKLSAGTENPLAATYSPFSLRLSREDGTQELAGLSLDIPKGLLANLKGIPYCSDATLAAISGDLGTGAAQITQPSCPAASQVGTLTAGAGAGPTPFYSTTGKAYWAGPYKGAPVSLAVVVPAVAGPFDLGNVVVRNRFEVNPETAQITAVADPFPTALHGIPLDLRDVRVELTRPNYTLNPTSCDPMSFEADIVGAQGAVAHRSQHFQVAGCDRLRFKPKLSLRLRGSTKRGGHPALRAVLTMPQGGANIAAASVALPHSEFLAQNHIRTICTRVQYAAEQCPKGSIYGYARAYSPILDYYLQGPVYLRSSSHPLPDLVAHLGGQIEIDVVGRIDSVKGGIRSTFKGLPDAPVSKFVLEMPGGKKSLLENSVNICRREHRAAALFDAQNGKIRDLRPVLRPACGGKSKKRRHR